MKFLPLLWLGIWRKPGRTILIFLQIGIAFALFGVLQGMKTAVDQAAASARADLLLVHSRVSFADSLPLGGLERIKSVPGIKAVRAQDSFFGTYQKPTQGVAIVSVLDLDQAWINANPDSIDVVPEALEVLRKTRTGALVSTDLVKKYGWKVGDRIPLNGSIPQANGSTAWAFDVVGTFSSKEFGSHDFIFINFAYLDEARQIGKGTARFFLAVASDPKQAVTVADEIDRRFANSANETRTESYREMAQSQMQAVGDMDFVIRAIVSATLVAFLFSTATMLMQSIRERTPELGVLKTLGFTDHAVFSLILAETLVICVTAAAFGLGLAMLTFPLAAKMVPGLAMPKVILGIGLLGAVLIALVSAALPATRAARLQIVAALSDR